MSAVANRLRADGEEQRLHQPRQHERGREVGYEAETLQREAVAHEPAQHDGTLGPERPARDKSAVLAALT